MKKIILIIFPLLIWGCEKDHLDACFTSTGDDKTEYREVSNYTRIELDDRIDLDLRWDSINSLKVTAGKGIIDHVVTEVKDGVLKIYNENKCNFVRSFKRKIKVTLASNSFDEITYRGSGTINCLNILNPKILKLDCWEASGNINLNINCEESYLKSHTGPTSIKVKGTTNYSVLFLGGVGVIEAQDLVATNGYIVNNNSGDIYQKTLANLEVFINGDGNVISYGTADSISIQRNGKGSHYQR